MILKEFIGQFDLLIQELGEELKIEDLAVDLHFANYHAGSVTIWLYFSSNGVKKSINLELDTNSDLSDYDTIYKYFSLAIQLNLPKGETYAIH